MGGLWNRETFPLLQHQHYLCSFREGKILLPPSFSCIRDTTSTFFWKNQENSMGYMECLPGSQCVFMLDNSYTQVAPFFLFLERFTVLLYEKTYEASRFPEQYLDHQPAIYSFPSPEEYGWTKKWLGACLDDHP